MMVGVAKASSLSPYLKPQVNNTMYSRNEIKMKNKMRLKRL
jgi:hypothetical protein